MGETTKPREHPVLFSPPMILALLAGRKTVTRRLDKKWLKVKAGDRLWVRECFLLDERNSKGKVPQEVIYAATPEWCMDHTGEVQRVRFLGGEIVPPEYAKSSVEANKFWHKKPSIHMPRWASRITLEATEDARLERLQEITGEDCIAEGLWSRMQPAVGPVQAGLAWYWGHGQYIGGGFDTAAQCFECLWSTIHTKPGETWDDNPEAVRIAFKVAPHA